MKDLKIFIDGKLNTNLWPLELNTTIDSDGNHYVTIKFEGAPDVINNLNDSSKILVTSTEHFMKEVEFKIKEVRNGPFNAVEEGNIVLIIDHGKPVDLFSNWPNE